ncbi:hypothetical protein NDN08_007683 [Rhodosorus marinus]|uniref:Uncharacterized protein n=1 Tax=Rhodosorus marinus TaxID=101924 RepID=A0AAV8V336_9RHOD|nr:hypothetical protein NDN08_007683 [Rhodosorus marinus]
MDWTCAQIVRFAQTLTVVDKTVSLGQVARVRHLGTSSSLYGDLVSLTLLKEIASFVRDPTATYPSLCLRKGPASGHRAITLPRVVADARDLKEAKTQATPGLYLHVEDRLYYFTNEDMLLLVT